MCLALLCAACGFKGDLYLPRKNDDAKFGTIQTGINLKRPDAMRKRQKQPQIQTASDTTPVAETNNNHLNKEE